MKTIAHFMMRCGRAGSVLLPLFFGLALGCDSREEEPAPDPMLMITDTTDDPAGTASDSEADTTTNEVDLQGLNMVVREYVTATKKIPRSLDELVTSGFVPALPAPPQGQRFVILLHPLGYQVVLQDQ